METQVFAPILCVKGSGKRTPDLYNWDVRREVFTMPKPHLHKI